MSVKRGDNALGRRCISVNGGEENAVCGCLALKLDGQLRICRNVRSGNYVPLSRSIAAATLARIPPSYPIMIFIISFPFQFMYYVRDTAANGLDTVFESATPSPATQTPSPNPQHRRKPLDRLRIRAPSRLPSAAQCTYPNTPLTHRGGRGGCAVGTRLDIRRYPYSEYFNRFIPSVPHNSVNRP